MDDAFHVGVYRLIELPWNPYEMETVLHDALEAYRRLNRL
jgi:hypothetical protein